MCLNNFEIGDNYIRFENLRERSSCIIFQA